ncbi:MAG: adaptor protein MecA [Candidatus Limivivens sp.]|nr:adaptor protein MecA [Candidatus Limivivens sp.]
MTFWKISDTRISCRVTLQEIQEMGFDFQELTQDRQKTVDFLSKILENGKSVLGLELPDGIQSFTAQMLPDQSLLIVISCADIDKEIDRNMEMLQQRIEAMNQLAASGKIEQILSLEGQEKADAYNGLMEEIENLLRNQEEEDSPGETQVAEGVSGEIRRLDSPVPSICRVLFQSLDETIDFCSALGMDALPVSRLYKHKDQYYLFAEFSGEASRKQAAGFLSLAGEFGGDISGEGVSEAFLKEHDKCMIQEKAIEKLGDLQSRS